MAFSDAQKVSIRRYLGYPLGYYADSPLEGMMDKVGGVVVEQAAVETILAELATVDTTVATGANTAASLGSLAKADDTAWHPITNESKGTPVNVLERCLMLVERLRQCFGVRLAGRYFGTSPPFDNEMALG